MSSFKDQKRGTDGTPRGVRRLKFDMRVLDAGTSRSRDRSRRSSPMGIRVLKREMDKGLGRVVLGRLVRVFGFYLKG